VTPRHKSPIPVETRIRDPPFMRNVGLLITYHCQASCAHCILRAGPDRHEEVSMIDARNWIRQIAEYRNRYVYILSLTGGEPFSNLKLLRDVMECAAENRLYTSVITNAFWATERKKAKQILQSLPEICFLSISTDLYHQKFVSFDNVRNAVWAAQECDIPFYISVVADNMEDPDYKRVIKELMKLTEPENIHTGITFPVGRAADIKDELRYSLSSEPCPEVCTAASSPCIFPDGRVYGCIGPLLELGKQQPLYIGNLREHSVAEIFDRSETNAILHALRLWGPARLISWLREAGMGDHLPHVYVAGSSCQACYSMLSDPAVREWMRKLEQDEEFRRKVAYGRLYHLRETRMLELSNY
jgi:MoaA/NifB/PqqE/SkfB family radical SAM enzyme